jgi:RNA polymerase sigma-70 factor, ECF subfamily
MNEQEALVRLQRGDISGLETLVMLHQVEAIRAAFLITRDRAVAEDIVQMAFVRAYQRIAQFDPARPFRPWFLRSVLNDAIKVTQRQQRTVSLESDPARAEAILQKALIARGYDPAAQLEVAERRAIVWEAMEQLPPAQRAAIVQRYYLGLSEREMAEVAQRSAGAIKWRLHAARKRLRQLLAPYRSQVKEE